MKLLDSEIKHEKEYLKKVESVLNEEIDEMTDEVQKKMAEVNDIKRQIYEEKNDDSLYNQDAIRNVYAVESKVDQINKKIDKIELYKRAASIPYFGKITCDFNNDKENVYIGITSVEKDNNFFVYDWRSPIASLFYNYELGEASYKIDTKEIKCNIDRKIQFKIKDGELIRCFDSSINIDDEYLQEMLSNTNDKKLTNIISTIQKEQNQIIRNVDDKNLLVQGTAGSGKTVVALHRIAYLLYRDAKLESKNILIISPNEIFSDYISDVLPELGEKNTKCFTLTSYLESYLNSYKIEPYVKYISRIEDEECKDTSKKLNVSKELKRFVKNYYNEFNFTRKFTIGTETFHSKDINYMFNEKYKRLCIKDRFRRIAEFICNQLGIKNKDFYNKIKNYLISNSNINLDIYEVYKEFLKSQKLSTFLIDNDTIKYEDVMNILNIYFYVNGVKKDLSLKHVVIDEAQDYTLTEIDVIRKMFPEASFTILGDDNQNINSFDKSKIKDYSELFKSFKYIELNKTYRSTEKIVEFSNKILGLDNVCAVRNTLGDDVEIMKLSIDNLKKCIKNSNYKKTAIITDNMTKARKLYKELNDKDIQLIDFDTDTFDKNVFIIPSYLSKGLEFEYVIIYKEDEYKNKNLYYVSCTRAQQKLTILE